MALPVDLPTLLSFTLASFLIELTPGPNMTYLALVAASDGRRRAGFATVAGVASGRSGIVGLSGRVRCGGRSSKASTLLCEGLRWAGVLFLLYLVPGGMDDGNRQCRGSKAGTMAALFPARTDDQSAQSRGGRLLCRRAADFHRRGKTVLLSQTLTLTKAACVAVATAVHAAIVLLGRHAGAVPQRSAPRTRRPDGYLAAGTAGGSSPSGSDGRSRARTPRVDNLRLRRRTILVAGQRTL